MAGRRRSINSRPLDVSHISWRTQPEIWINISWFILSFVDQPRTEVGYHREGPYSEKRRRRLHHQKFSIEALCANETACLAHRCKTIWNTITSWVSLCNRTCLEHVTPAMDWCFFLFWNAFSKVLVSSNGKTANKWNSFYRKKTQVHWFRKHVSNGDQDLDHINYGFQKRRSNRRGWVGVGLSII